MTICAPPCPQTSCASAARYASYLSDRQQYLRPATEAALQTDCSTTVTNRIHQVYNLSCELRRYTMAEIEMAVLMSQLNGHSERYSHDTSGLAYLAGAVLAGSIYRQMGEPATSRYMADAYRTVQPISSQLDIHA